MDIFLALLALSAIFYLWYRTIYSPGKYKNRNRSEDKWYSDDDFWSSSDSDSDGGGDD